MRTRDYFPIVLLGGIAAFIVVQGREMGRTRKVRPRVVAHVTDTAAPAVQPQGVRKASPPIESASIDVTRPVELRASDVPPPKRDDAVVRETIRDNHAGTYIMDVLQQQDQMLMRWPEERNRDALRVWIQRGDLGIADWSQNYPIMAERAFDEWKVAGFPLRFDIVTDPVGSDIQIRWTDRFPPSEGLRVGVTNKARDQSGWLVTAEIIIATHDRNGMPLTPETVAGIARHEIGHALGLGHSPDPKDVMYPESRTPAISDADRATMNLIYRLPPGLVK